jgi:hypothetical protein
LPTRGQRPPRRFPPGIQSPPRQSGRTAALLGLGTLVVYLTLAAQYESFVLPFIVLMAVPLALLGALGAQWLRGLQNDYCGSGGSCPTSYSSLGNTYDCHPCCKQTRQLWKLYRDGRGRWRQESSETLESGEQVRFALITDYKRRRFVVLDLATGQVMNQMTAAGAKAYQALGRLPTSDAVTAADAPGDAAQVEDLSEKDLEGVRVRGRRITTGTGVVEVWSSPIIDQPPLLVRAVRPGEERRQRLFNIHLGEPEPALFAVLDTP